MEEIPEEEIPEKEEVMRWHWLLLFLLYSFVLSNALPAAEPMKCMDDEFKVLNTVCRKLHDHMVEAAEEQVKNNPHYAFYLLGCGDRNVWLKGTGCFRNNEKLLRFEPDHFMRFLDCIALRWFYFGNWYEISLEDSTARWKCAMLPPRMLQDYFDSLYRHVCGFLAGGKSNDKTELLCVAEEIYLLKLAAGLPGVVGIDKDDIDEKRLEMEKWAAGRIAEWDEASSICALYARVLFNNSKIDFSDIIKERKKISEALALKFFSDDVQKLDDKDMVFMEYALDIPDDDLMPGTKAYINREINKIAQVDISANSVNDNFVLGVRIELLRSAMQRYDYRIILMNERKKAK